MRGACQCPRGKWELHIFWKSKEVLNIGMIKLGAVGESHFWFSEANRIFQISRTGMLYLSPAIEDWWPLALVGACTRPTISQNSTSCPPCCGGTSLDSFSAPIGCGSKIKRFQHGSMIGKIGFVNKSFCYGRTSLKYLSSLPELGRELVFYCYFYPRRLATTQTRDHFFQKRYSNKRFWKKRSQVRVVLNTSR